MLTDLISRIITRLTNQLKYGSYSCGKCGLKIEVTDYPDRVSRVLDIAIAHNCKPSKPKPAKTL
ncbi:hypothetical protein SAMN04490357_7670 [Streptomyces misionensis]|uniref:Uncharacterized protein n=1 Tax=Streptomyces misionensis TaxID=67331 RepID=A0A1H5K2K9_9ACTN|nr:hypothetical protein [Streptomyces misionensis]SEE58890.1 hypothetical protein SAMN04490357_7670 [Streptomyces misionensis]